MALAARTLTFAWSLAALLAATGARAADPFEIQVYDGTANDPGQAGLELHTNFVAKGIAPNDKIAHFTLEPSYGLFSWWELGGYFQTALRTDPSASFEYAGVKLRSKFVTPQKWADEHGHFRFGVNLELDYLPAAYDPDRWGGEIRPIAAYEDDRWAFAFNPIIGVPLAGDGWRHGPDFEPAGSAAYKLTSVSLGLEYYSSLGFFSDLAPIDAQEHYLYEVVNLLGVENLELNAGIGEGLTGGSNKIVIKTILGYSF